MHAIAEKPAIDFTTDYSPIHLKAPGTCGELVQGAIDGHDFLVNCPINLFSYAKVRIINKSGLSLKNSNQYTKIRDTILLASEEFRFPLMHEVSISSDIPRGKGMASSSADITAAFEAVCRSSEISLPPEVFTHIVTEIEPSDCVNFPGIAHLNHLTGQCYESLPVPENMSVIVFDCGGQIDTISFDRIRARQLYKQEETYMRETLQILRKGLHGGNVDLVAQAATRSAQFNQQIHPKPQFEDLLSCTQEVGALGVNCAHSGTVLGVLYKTDETTKEMLLEKVIRTFGKDLDLVGDYHIISGGCYEV